MVPPPDLSAAVPMLAGAGVAVVLGLIVASTPIGSGDYGQWLMVSRAFGGESFPEYRLLSGVPPIVPLLVGLASKVAGDPVLGLHLVALIAVVGLAVAFYAAAWSVDGRPLTGLVAVVVGLLVTDRFLELLAFGGLPQVVAIAFLMLAVAAFSQALRSRATQRRWWMVGCAALFAMCLSHVPTTTIGLPTCVAIAALGVLQARGEPMAARIRALAPLALGFATIGVYWLLVIAPASIGFVANPASLSYRGPERVFDILALYPPTLVVIAIGAAWLGGWVVTSIVRHRLPDRGDRRLVLLAWLATAWGAFAFSAASGVSTDFPRFVPLLLAPFVIAAAVALGSAGRSVTRRLGRQPSMERGLVAIGIAVVLIAPFSIARYQTEAHGYELPDDTSLAAAAAWADRRLVPGATILAPVREAKWIEGLTGRSALFSSDVRYAFRPVEWERSLAAAALMRANFALANESFVLTFTDGVASTMGQQPRSLLVGANHGGEYVELLRLVPGSSRVIGAGRETLASVPALKPAGWAHATTPELLTATTIWSGIRSGIPVSYVQTVGLAAGSRTFTLEVLAATALPAAGLQIELRPPSGVALLGIQPVIAEQPGLSDQAAVLTFARLGNAEPKLQVTIQGEGTIGLSRSGGVLLEVPGSRLRVAVTDLSPGGASSGLRLLDPAALMAAHGVGAAVLRHDTAYDARRARLEDLGFYVAHAEGPYIVMVRTGFARPEVHR